MLVSEHLQRHRSGDNHELTNLINSFYSNDFFPYSMKKSLTLSGHKGCINTCSFNSNGEFELTGCDDGCIYLWDIASHNTTPKLRIAPHKTNVFTTNFLNVNKFISAGNDADVKVIEVAEGRVHETNYHNHHTRKVLCSFVIDENTFATCSYDKTVRIFDTRIKYKNQTSDELEILNDEYFNYDNQKILMDLSENGLRPQNDGGGLIEEVDIQNIDNESLLLDFKKEKYSEFYTMDIHPIDRKRFITSANDGTVRMFDLRMIQQNKPQEMGFEFNNHYKGIKSITGATFNDSGEKIAATVLGGNIHILDTSSAVDLKVIPKFVPRRRINFNVIDNDLINLIFRANVEYENNNEEESEIGENQETKVNGEIIELSGHQSFDTIKGVNWMGKYVVTGSDEGNVYLYDSDNGKIKNILKGHENHVNVVSVNKEKMLLSTSGIDDYAILWESNNVTKINLKSIEENISQILEENEMSAQQNPCGVM